MYFDSNTHGLKIRALDTHSPLSATDSSIGCVTSPKLVSGGFESPRSSPSRNPKDPNKLTDESHGQAPVRTSELFGNTFVKLFKGYRPINCMFNEMLPNTLGGVNPPTVVTLWRIARNCILIADFPWCIKPICTGRKSSRLWRCNFYQFPMDGTTNGTLYHSPHFR